MDLLARETGVMMKRTLVKRSDRAISAKAAEQSLWLSALSEHYAGALPRQGFVLGFGNTRTAQIAPAIRQLRKFLR